MNFSVVTAATFVTGALLAVGGFSLISDVVIRPRARVRTRLREQFHNGVRERAKKSQLFKNLSQIATDPDVRDPSLWSRFTDVVEQSGIDVTPQRVLGISGVVGVTSGIACWIISHSTPAACVVAFIGVLAPIAYVYGVRQRRVRVLCSQLPEAFDLIGRAVRAGQTVSRAFQMVADECDSPLAGEFAYCYEQQNLGLSPDIALCELARRTGVVELQMFVVALIVQRQSGGNPVEMLTNLASMVRKRIRMQGKLRALTAEGRMQAAVLVVLPVVMFIAVYILNREYAQVLLDRPRLLLGMLVSEVIGAVWVSRIARLDA